jgi:hypothetical protein
MHVQILSFDGPRSDAVVDAADRAQRDRIRPLIDADPQLRGRLLGGFRGVGSDGAQCVVLLARDVEAFDVLERLVMTSELLPGEDPALLPGPSRIDRYAASDVFGDLADAFGDLADVVAGADR